MHGERIDQRAWRAVAMTALALLALALPASGAEWIWCERDGARTPSAHLRKDFSAPSELRRATLRAVADFADADVLINGASVATLRAYGPLVEVDVASAVRHGANSIALRGVGVGGPAAIALTLRLEAVDGSELALDSDASWTVASDADGKLEAPERSSTATSYGELVELPWRADREDPSITALHDYNQWERALARGSETSPAAIRIAPGFEIELLRSAREGEGSWVGMTIDRAGRIFIGKEDRGILRLTLPDADGGESDGEIEVDVVEDMLRECRGLAFSGDVLYADANESKALYRLRDTDGDGRFDEREVIYRSGGSTGHGRNDIAVGPDGALWVIHGDAVEVPLDCPDATSPFRERRPADRSAEGHLMRIAPDGSSHELIASGLRNPYGIDFDAEGEMFSYDADAEHDMGAPWYRPTRVVHLVRGADYGWRGVTGSWPPYYPDEADNAPASLAIGKGSPTSVKFGSRSRFPAPYRDALFILDWAYGRILAVHRTPRGASYAMSSETFVEGRPLNVTDLDFGPDGAMVLITGGRKTSSSLYRIRFAGDETTEAPPTRQQRERALACAGARALRRALESYHRPDGERAVDFAWPHLASADPWIRHAARVAIEHQPIAVWRERALGEERPMAALSALMALARSRAREQCSAVLARLDRFPVSELAEVEQEIWLRACELCLDTLGDLDASLRSRIVALLDNAYPARAIAVNRALSALLARLDAPSVVVKTMALVDTETRQEDLLHSLFVLRGVRAGWTDDLRVAYFRALRRMDDFSGGAGMPVFIATIRSEAEALLTPREEALVAPILAASAADAGASPPEEERAFVRRWALDDFPAPVDLASSERSFERGRAMFRTALCARCHRVQGEGGSFGPDLSSVASRFGRRDLLASILRPSDVVAEPYRAVTLVKRDGSIVAGHLLASADYRRSVIRLIADPLRPDRVTEIPKPDIARFETSSVSPMPEGLLDTLAQGEILDLLAYLEAGGGEDDPLFGE